jgi:hypothetical protein
MGVISIEWFPLAFLAFRLLTLWNPFRWTSWARIRPINPFSLRKEMSAAYPK